MEDIKHNYRQIYCQTKASGKLGGQQSSERGPVSSDEQRETNVEIVTVVKPRSNKGMHKRNSGSASKGPGNCAKLTELV